MIMTESHIIGSSLKDQPIKRRGEDILSVKMSKATIAAYPEDKEHLVGWK